MPALFGCDSGMSQAGGYRFLSFHSQAPYQDAGDHEVEALKACMLGMLGSGKCQSIILIEPDGRRIYHSNLFSKMIYRLREIAQVS